nr:uncharacterized protein LOC126521574 [Dermacentor andersoni]
MLLTLAVAAAAVLLLLKRVTHTVVKRTRLLLGYCRHYLIESTADGAGTAMEVISQIHIPSSSYQSVLVASFLGLCVLVCALKPWRRLSRMRAHRARAPAVPSRLSAGEPAGTDFLEDNDPLSSEHLSANIDEVFANLLAACGQQTCATFDQLFNRMYAVSGQCQSESVNHLSYEAVVQHLDNHFDPQVNEIAASYAFFMRNQAEGEKRRLESVLQGLPRVKVYLDDIIIAEKQNDNSTLRQVLERLRDNGLKLNRDKCRFREKQVSFLGHKIDATGLHPPENMEAITEAPRPETVSQLKSFLGLLTYYAKFLPNLATTLVPLYRLLAKGVRWQWKAEHEKAFQAAKRAMVAAELLVHYDPEKPLRLECDASPVGVGAVLSHRIGNTDYPISFRSRALTPAERNYSQLEKEALALVFGVTKFRDYFVSREHDKFEKIAEGENSEVFRVHTYTGDSVLKVVKLGSTQESQDRLLTKIKIASRLAELRERLDYFTKGFVELKSVTCVFDSYPEELLEARERAALHDERRDENKSVRTPRAYLAWHMSYGGVPLDQLKLDSTVQIWSILHQVALSLAVAEEALEFEHRALLMRRVLVKYTLEKTSRFTIRGRDYLIETWFLEASILGGASARLSDGDTAVFTVTEDLGDLEPIDRALLDVDINMKMIVRNDWRAFYPLTNLLWLHHVTKKLRRQYKQTFGRYMNDFEKVFWTDIGSWKQELLQYSSLAEFVNNLPDVRAQRRQGGLTTTTAG